MCGYAQFVNIIDAWHAIDSVIDSVGECPKAFGLLAKHFQFGAFGEVVGHLLPYQFELIERASVVVCASVYQFFVHLAKVGENARWPFDEFVAKVYVRQLNDAFVGGVVGAVDV